MGEFTESAEVIIEVLNGLLGLVALALSVRMYRSSKYSAAAWRWIAIGIGLFAASELSVVMQLLLSEPYLAIHSLVYRALQLGFVGFVSIGLALKLPALPPGGDGP